MYQLAKGVTTHSHVRRKKLKRKEGGTVIISKRRYFTRFCFSLSISHSFDVDCPPHLAVTQTSRNEAIERGAVRGSNANSRRRPQRVNKLQFSFSLSFLFVSFFFSLVRSGENKLPTTPKMNRRWEGDTGPFAYATSISALFCAAAASVVVVDVAVVRNVLII